MLHSSQMLCKEERQKGIMGVDPAVPSTITAFPPGYINQDLEVRAGHAGLGWARLQD
jgi:hypothetical protein